MDRVSVLYHVTNVPRSTAVHDLGFIRDVEPRDDERWAGLASLLPSEKGKLRQKYDGCLCDDNAPSVVFWNCFLYCGRVPTGSCYPAEANGGVLGTRYYRVRVGFDRFGDFAEYRAFSITIRSKGGLGVARLPNNQFHVLLVPNGIAEDWIDEKIQERELEPLDLSTNPYIQYDDTRASISLVNITTLLISPLRSRKQKKE